MTSIELFAPDGIGEVVAGADLVALVCDAVELADGDIVVLTSKVVSKAEGMLVPGERDAAIAGETVRVVAVRGPVRIVENHLGLVMAAAGVDNSNVPAGVVALLPRDPDASARRLRAGIEARTGRNVGVVVADTAGRAWRLGQTDIAIGAAGLEPLQPFAGQVDGHGNPLAVTEPAVADELAGAAELASGKLGGRPVIRVRGLAALVLPSGESGPGASALVRPRELDLFSLGARDAVVAALAGDASAATDAGAFGPPAPLADLAAALDRCELAYRCGPAAIEVETPDDAARTRCAVLARAHGWSAIAGDAVTVLRDDTGA